MINTKFTNESVCYAGGKIWFPPNDVNDYLVDGGGTCVELRYILDCPDLQINEIRTGDFISASELDTEQKYNEVVEVFGLFGFEWGKDASTSYFDKNSPCDKLRVNEDGLFKSDFYETSKTRKLTYSQIIAIGKLKRMMLAKIGAESIKNNPPINSNDDNSEMANAAMAAFKKATQGKAKSAVDYLTECVEVQKQRGEQYDSTGTGERSFDAAAKAYNALTGENIKGSDVCLILTCVKAVRQYSNPNRLHEDSLLDLVSYASLWTEELNKELK